VNVRRKGFDFFPDSDDRVKVSLKVDFDDRLPDLEWHGHRKLSLEAGRGLGRGVLLREGIAWQAFARAGVILAALFLGGKRLGCEDAAMRTTTGSWTSPT
jgi:hypothetical protein